MLQILFLQEVEEIIDVADSNEFRPVAARFARQLLQSSTSPHFQV
jgi:hypothetical protein